MTSDDMKKKRSPLLALLLSAAFKKWALFSLRWGIAIFGVVWVVSQIKLHDTVLVLDDSNLPVEMTLAEPAEESAAEYVVEDPSGKTRTVPWDRVVNQADQKSVKIVDNAGDTADAKLLALRLKGDINKNPQVDELLIEKAGRGAWVKPAELAGGHYDLRVPRPRVLTGLRSMLHDAKRWLIVAAFVVFIPTFIITSYRWKKLLQALEVHMALSRVFVLNMVGAFYNTFMPGSTGGDLLKAYYASKHTPHRMQAAMSVVIDRVLGLIALLILGGVMAAFQYFRSAPGDPIASACGRVALGSLGIMAGLFVVLLLLGVPKIRRATGLEHVINMLPMQRHVWAILDCLRVYRSRWGLVLWAMIVTLPVHITVVISAMFAGWAFGLPISTVYYFVAVPVMVLSAAVPISPQGAGVMEWFAIHLTQRQGATVSQAVALTLSIRLVQIFWNLTGGIFVFRGGYHAPTEAEEHAMEEDVPEAPGIEPLPE